MHRISILTLISITGVEERPFMAAFTQSRQTVSKNHERLSLLILLGIYTKQYYIMNMKLLWETFKKVMGI